MEGCKASIPSRGLEWKGSQLRMAGFRILRLYWGCIGIMEKKMEFTILYWGIYWGYIGLGFLSLGESAAVRRVNE